jgi:hypothetical protein
VGITTSTTSDLSLTHFYPTLTTTFTFAPSCGSHWAHYLFDVPTKSIFHDYQFRTDFRDC